MLSFFIIFFNIYKYPALSNLLILAYAYNINYKSELNLFFISYIIYFLFTNFIHKSTCLFWMYNLDFFKFLNKFIIFLTPDYLAAHYAKLTFITPAISDKLNELELTEIENFKSKSFLLIFWNYLNFMFSLLAFFAIYFYSIFGDNFFKNFLNSSYGFPIKKIFFFFFFIRVISRSVELILAFFNDIVSNKIKNPYLKSSTRIKLAISSLFEIILNNSILVYLNFRLNIFQKYIIPDIFLEKNNNVDIFLLTFIQRFGISTSTSATLTSVLSILQIITTLVLILFAFAGYINSKEYVVTTDHSNSSY